MPGAGEYASPGPADYVALNDEDPGGGGVPPDAVPIDGGAGWLLAAGASYGIKKLRDRRMQKSEVENEVGPEEQQQEL